MAVDGEACGQAYAGRVAGAVERRGAAHGGVVARGNIGLPFAVVAGDTILYESDGVSGGIVTPPPEKTEYTVVYDRTRTNSAFRRSMTTHSEWTFSSGHSGGRTVPEQWECATERGEDDGPAECSALPVVVPRHRLGAAPDGTGPTGDDQLVVTFGHVPGVVAPPAVTRATVEASFDDGTWWTAASTASPGQDHPGLRGGPGRDPARHRHRRGRQRGDADGEERVHRRRGSDPGVSGEAPAVAEQAVGQAVDAPAGRCGSHRRRPHRVRALRKREASGAPLAHRRPCRPPRPGSG